jgi:hypothetical protein
MRWTNLTSKTNVAIATLVLDSKVSQPIIENFLYLEKVNVWQMVSAHRGAHEDLVELLHAALPHTVRQFVATTRPFYAEFMKSGMELSTK